MADFENREHLTRKRFVPINVHFTCITKCTKTSYIWKAKLIAFRSVNRGALVRDSAPVEQHRTQDRHVIGWTGVFLCKYGFKKFEARIYYILSNSYDWKYNLLILVVCQWDTNSVLFFQYRLKRFKLYKRIYLNLCIFLRLYTFFRNLCVESNIMAPSKRVTMTGVKKGMKHKDKLKLNSQSFQNNIYLQFI